MTAKPPTLPKPVEVAKFWKNRWRRDAIVVALSTYEGRNLISVRTYATSQDGKMLPTAKGVALAVARLPELAAAVTKALAKARELGLLDDESEGSE
jgi:Transcriptional Coactivator p15 (PC4)